MPATMEPGKSAPVDKPTMPTDTANMIVPLRKNTSIFEIAEIRNLIYKAYVPCNSTSTTAAPIEQWLSMRSLANTSRRTRDEFWPLCINNLDMAVPYLLEIRELDSFLKAHFPAVNYAEGEEEESFDPWKAIKLQISMPSGQPSSYPFTLDIKNLITLLNTHANNLTIDIRSAGNKLVECYVHELMRMQVKNLVARTSQRLHITPATLNAFAAITLNCAPIPGHVDQTVRIWGVRLVYKRGVTDGWWDDPVTKKARRRDVLETLQLSMTPSYFSDSGGRDDREEDV